MKKHTLLITILLLICQLTACSTKAKHPVIQEATEMTNKQVSCTLKQFSYYGIDCIAATASSASFVDGMSEDFNAYDLTDTNDNEYVLILTKSSKEFIALLHSDGELMCGLIDNHTTPKLFEDK